MENRVSKVWHTWIAVMALGFAAFIFNTTEFVPIALLTDIGTSFHLAPTEVDSAARAGIMITIYAWVVALMSLPLVIIMGAMERKRLMIIVFIVFILSHIVCYFAPSFHWLIAGRIGVALAHALFWSITSAIAIRVAPPGKKSAALAIIATGTSLATILGIPIGRAVGMILGWRITFLMVAVIALVVLGILIKVLPRLPNQNSGSIKSVPILLKRGIFVGLILVTAIVVSGNFTVYSYIETFSENRAHISEAQITLLLFVFGGAGLIGSFLFSQLNPLHPLFLLPTAIFLLFLVLLFLSKTTYSQILFFSAIFFWGIAFSNLCLGFQIKVLDVASDATDIAMSMYSAIFNIGIGSGALFGNLIISRGNLNVLNDIGAGIVFLAFVILVSLFAFYRKSLMKISQEK